MDPQLITELVFLVCEVTIGDDRSRHDRFSPDSHTKREPFGQSHATVLRSTPAFDTRTHETVSHMRWNIRTFLRLFLLVGGTVFLAESVRTGDQLGIGIGALAMGVGAFGLVTEWKADTD